MRWERGEGTEGKRNIEFGLWHPNVFLRKIADIAATDS